MEWEATREANLWQLRTDRYCPAAAILGGFRLFLHPVEASSEEFGLNKQLGLCPSFNNKSCDLKNAAYMAHLHLKLVTCYWMKARYFQALFTEGSALTALYQVYCSTRANSFPLRACDKAIQTTTSLLQPLKLCNIPLGAWVDAQPFDGHATRQGSPFGFCFLLFCFFLFFLI